MDETEAMVEAVARAICCFGDEHGCAAIGREPAAVTIKCGVDEYRHQARAAVRTLAPLIAEQCAGIAENPNKAGREWVPGSLWDNIARETATAIRAAFPKEPK